MTLHFQRQRLKQHLGVGQFGTNEARHLAQRNSNDDRVFES